MIPNDTAGFFTLIAQTWKHVGQTPCFESGQKSYAQSVAGIGNAIIGMALASELWATRDHG